MKLYPHIFIFYMPTVKIMLSYSTLFAVAKKINNCFPCLLNFFKYFIKTMFYPPFLLQQNSLSLMKCKSYSNTILQIRNYLRKYIFKNFLSNRIENRLHLFNGYSLNVFQILHIKNQYVIFSNLNFYFVFMI